jgi:hypothetical protein
VRLDNRFDPDQGLDLCVETVGHLPSTKTQNTKTWTSEIGEKKELSFQEA